MLHNVCSDVMKIQLEMNEKENEIVSIFKIRNKFKTKQLAIKKIIQICGGEVDGLE